MSHSLQTMFPSLSLFSDIDWEAVTREYETGFIDVSFPEYLQQKALDGDCPPWLFELAYFELALFNARTSAEAFPCQPGVYLNPTALFLSLEYDVGRMLEDARLGSISVIERPHVMGIYRNQQDEVRTSELTTEELNVLELLEEGPLPDAAGIPAAAKAAFEQLRKAELIIDLT